MGLVDKWPSRMQGQWFFQSRAGGHKFPVGSMKSIIIFGGLPLPESTSPEKFVGGGFLSPNIDSVVQYDKSLEIV